MPRSSPFISPASPRSATAAEWRSLAARGEVRRLSRPAAQGRQRRGDLLPQRRGLHVRCAALHRRTAKPDEFCTWAFDLLELNGKDQRPQPLSVRRAKLAELLERFDNSFVRFSEGFGDGEKLLAECERLGLEGIVSKRLDQPYRSIRSDWIKVKTRAWREANRNRGELIK